HLDGSAGDGRLRPTVAGALPDCCAAGGVSCDRQHRDGARAYRYSSFVWPTAGNAAGDMGYQPDDYSAGTHDVWRPEPGGGKPGMAVRWCAGVCQSDAAVE